MRKVAKSVRGILLAVGIVAGLVACAMLSRLPIVKATAVVTAVKQY